LKREVGIKVESKRKKERALKALAFKVGKGN
jgi:hypothetical protein